MLNSPNDTKPIDTINPIEIAEVIDRLVARIRADGNADLLAVWAVATLAGKLGITVIQATSTEAVDVFRDLGDDWAASVLEASRVNPDGAHRVLLAAHGAFQTIMRARLSAD